VVRVRGEPVALSPLAEEMAYQLAKKKDTPYVQDPVFVENFMKSFSKELPAPYQAVGFGDVDFSQFYDLVDHEKRTKESLTKEDKKALAGERKVRREEMKAKYGKAFVDGKEIDVANWLVEPPGLFLGRGAHPLRGSWKPRIFPSDVTLNLDESAPVPSGAWGAVVHDHDSIWIARWIDGLTGKEKYVWPHESSDIQQSRNKEKYDKALRIRGQLAHLRSTILKSMAARDLRTRKVATVSYLIDHLGMRVGDEKDEDEADTVGATTLRVEHIKIGEKLVEFDFLGKDSVRWVKTIENPEEILVKNLGRFIDGKKPQDEIFDIVTSGMVNRFLSDIVPGLTAKVFRTYHASDVTEKSLRRRDMKGAEDLDKLFFAREANLEAAIFCNHKRTPPKTWDESMKKKEQKLEEYRAKGKTAMVEKLSRNIDFLKRTKDYNLNTSLKNYIDPRIYKSWCDHVELDWTRLYTASLQRKFNWVNRSKKPWVKEQEQVATVA
jgi:DNA topoisomerase-1